MRFSAMAFTVMVVVAFALIAQGATQKPPSFPSSVQVVTTSVTVINKKKQFVSGLTKENFAVYENGNRQTINTFQEQDLPMDLVLMLDMSASMGSVTGQYDHKTVLDIAKRAAEQFVDTLRPQDRILITIFYDIVVVAQAGPDAPLFTDDKVFAKKFIDTMQAQGKTRLRAAIYSVLKQYLPKQDPEHPRRTVVVLITDGEDTASPVDPERTLKMAHDSGAEVYSIELPHQGINHQGWQEGEEAHDFLLTLAKQTGGTVQTLKTPLDAAKAYTAIAQELRSQYRLSYTSSNTAQPGQWQQIIIQTIGNSNDGWTIRHRLGYYAR